MVVPTIPWTVAKGSCDSNLCACWGTSLHSYVIYYWLILVEKSRQ